MNFVFLGDSLMQQNDMSTFPQTGWPSKFNKFVRPEKEILFKNFAKNGRSTKSFIDEGLFDAALSVTKKGDIAFISFGHNDEKKEDETRYTDSKTSYVNNLKFMYDKIKEKGADVIFLTSITRLKYQDEKLLRTHLDYPDEMKKLALRLDAKCIDLEKITYDELKPYEYFYNSKYYMVLPKGRYDNYMEGLVDNTHLNNLGAVWISFLVYKELKKDDKYKDLLI